MRKFFLYLTLVFAYLTAEENTLYILHTNNTNGALENCYCPDHPYGAIEKRSIFIRDFINKHSNTIVIDAGDFLPVTNRPFLDSLVIAAYATLPYDAILVGDQELANKNIDVFIKRLGYSAIAANITSRQNLGLESHVIFERGGFNLGIIGIVHPSVFRFYPKELKDRFTFDDPEETIRDFIYEFSDSLDLIIALTHQGFEKDILLAQSLSGLDVIVGSHTQTKLEAGNVVNDCLIVQAGKEGYYVGIVEINFDDEKNIISSTSRLETMTLKMQDDPYIMELISALEKETGHINRNKLKQQKSE